jgi:hypothetical protein
MPLSRPTNRARHGCQVPQWLGLSGPGSGLEDFPSPKAALHVLEYGDRTRGTGGGGLTYQESRLMLDQAIVTGRGRVFLNLTAERYTKLSR